MRRALGASRGRILLQLLVEAAVLSTLGGLAGVPLARWGLDALARILATTATVEAIGLPFWWRWELKTDALAYVAGLTILGALVVGILPALKLTRQPTGQLLRWSGRGGVAPPFGRTAKVAIALQVSLSVALLAIAAAQWPKLLAGSEAAVSALRPERYLTARFQFDEVPSDLTLQQEHARLWALTRDLGARLSDEPGVVGVALATAFPGMQHPVRFVELEGGSTAQRAPVRVASVGPRFFDVLDAPVSLGRTFNSADVAPDGAAQPVVIANQSLVRRLLEDANPIGRRVRFAAPRPDGEPGPWLEIVGVVEDLGMDVSDPDAPEGLYLPLTDDDHPTTVAARLGGAPVAFEPRLRSLAATVDPTLRLLEVRTLEGIVRDAHSAQRWTFLGILVATAAALSLSLCGVYALTSFLVAQRAQEIGIRVALGAGPQRIVREILTKALAPALLGMVLGGVLALVLGPRIGVESVGLATGVSVAMAGAALLACLAPALRAVRVPPTKAIQSGF